MGVAETLSMNSSHKQETLLQSSMALSSPVCLQIQLHHNSITKFIYVYKGMDLDELHTVLCHAFRVPSGFQIVGISDLKKKIHFPFSLLTKAPINFVFDSVQQNGYEIVVHHSSSPVVTMADTPKKSKQEKVRMLLQYSLTFVLDIFQSAAPTGQLDVTTLKKCLESNFSSDHSTKVLLEHLFTTFDVENLGVIDLVMFLSGCSVLTTGDRDVKIRTVFDLYDTDQDELITVEEMARYLSSIFTVIAMKSPALFEQHGYVYLFHRIIC